MHKSVKSTILTASTAPRPLASVTLISTRQMTSSPNFSLTTLSTTTMTTSSARFSVAETGVVASKVDLAVLEVLVAVLARCSTMTSLGAAWAEAVSLPLHFPAVSGAE